MGHIRLGNLPRTRKWQQVVALIEGGAGTAQIATATTTAAEQGFKLAAEDKGLVETVWLLTQLPLAARNDNFGQALRNAGLDVSDTPGLMEVVGAFSDAIDRKLANNGGRTDLGEMAQMAASETMSKIIGSRIQNLFGTTSDDIKNAFSKLATNKQFSMFAREFFARLTNKCLDYFVSKAVSQHVGEGKRFRTLAQQSEFTRALGIHSREASKIVEEFSGGWFSKTNWENEGISRKDAAGFTHVAMKKIVSELKEGAPTNG
ncbi:MAG: hypothetical protein A2521_09475 [Deltaproteobacteria bacterium RIFOXYD12_FULL_57_12]|nr:MAG: hypothetical protein A2521_09475 [Deltaproteobacteria bacterium RIFOXYD12_FULL_57_12]